MPVTNPATIHRLYDPNPPANMVLIPAGSFTMGDTSGPRTGWRDESPPHTVYVSAFYMDQYEVTKAMWDEVYQWATNRPVELRYSFDYADSGQGKVANHPAQNLTWCDAVKWCNARSEKDGRTPAYYMDAAQTTIYRTGQTNLQNDRVKWNGDGYRLPTEAEWEKAARGGAYRRRFPWADPETIEHSRANYNSILSYPYDVSPTSGYHPTFNDGVYPYTSPVGYFAANGYGLFDVAGNVNEWCWDWYVELYYGISPASDPHGPEGGLYRVLRGGSWQDPSYRQRCARRNYGLYGGGRADVIGLRCMRGL